MLLINSHVNPIADLLTTHWACMSLRMDNPAAKISNLALFRAVLHLITACTKFVAREIDRALICSSKFSQADRDKLKRTTKGLVVLGLLARIIGQNLRIQEQKPIRGGRSVNIRTNERKTLPVAQDEEHAIMPKPDGGTLV